MRGVRPGHWLLSIVLLGGHGATQAPAPAPAPAPIALASTFVALRAQLGELSSDERVRMLEAFLAGGGRPVSELVRARLMLANARLQRLETEPAATLFREVLTAAAPSERHLRAAASLGLAQCEELLGRPAEGRAILLAVSEDYADLRHSRYARVALRRLEDGEAKVARIGEVVEEFATVLDTRGKGHRLSSTAGQPHLLLFFAPGDQRAEAWVQRLVAAFRRTGGSAEAALAFALHPDPSAAQETVTRRRWDFPVIPSEGAYLSPVVLQLGVHALPHAVLLGPDRSLLLGNPTPRALEGAMRVLIGRPQTPR